MSSEDFKDIIRTASMATMGRVLPVFTEEVSEDKTTVMVGVTYPNPEDTKDVQLRTYISDKMRARNPLLRMFTKWKPLPPGTAFHHKQEGGVRELPVVGALVFTWWEKGSS